MDWTNVVSVGISVLALGVSAWGVRHAKVSAEAARRSADASERSAEAAERQAAAAEAALPPPPPPVVWHVARKGGPNSYLLRNVGTESAASVEIDGDGGLVRLTEHQTSEASRLSPGQSVGFWVVTADQLPEVSEIRVRWAGSGGWVVVPLP
ncbi:hypothetical protein ACFY3U_03860 [Micromonospora sp. NPDC000089]|uniref:hypothetical protein n=1 Tax=unclassified Micromonospora TaxID=2617518 RepID=UPI0036C8AE9B